MDLTQPREDQDDPRQQLPRDDRSSKFERPLDFPWVSLGSICGESEGELNVKVNEKGSALDHKSN